jgi:hypothetical protein
MTDLPFPDHRLLLSINPNERFNSIEDALHDRLLNNYPEKQKALKIEICQSYFCLGARTHPFEVSKTARIIRQISLNC